MNRLRILPVFALIALSTSLLLAAGQELAARSGEKITFDLQGGGDIEVTGWERESALVTTEIEGRDAAQVKIDVERTSGGIRVSSPSRHGNSKVRVKVIAQVPRRYDVEVNSMGGDVALTNLEGTFDGRTMGGDVTLSGLTGEANLTTMGGDIEVEKSELDGTVSTMGGDILFDTVIGNLDGSTMGGDVIQRNVQPRAGAAGEPVRIRSHGGDVRVDTAAEGADVHTMGGDIHVVSADKFLKAATMGGDIEVERASGDTDLETMGGDIAVESFDGEIKAVTMGGDVAVKVTGTETAGGHDIKLDSMGGDLTLELPAGFSGRFEIELVKLREHESRAKIASDIPLDIVEPSEWTPGRRETDGQRYGSDYKIIRATGTVGSGEHRVRLKTVSGIIRIEQR